MNKMLLKTEFEILEYFIKGKDKLFHGRELSRLLNKNQKTISNSLIKLEKKNILSFNYKGKNKYYFLNFDNPTINEIINLVEINKKIKFLNKNITLIDPIRELEKNCNGILVIFGSYAKGNEKKKSDIDLFLIGNINNLELIKKTYNLKLHIIKSDKKKFKKNNFFIKEIIENHIIIKGVEEFTKLWYQ